MTLREEGYRLEVEVQVTVNRCPQSAWSGSRRGKGKGKRKGPLVVGNEKRSLVVGEAGSFTGRDRVSRVVYNHTLGPSRLLQLSTIHRFHGSSVAFRVWHSQVWPGLVSDPVMGLNGSMVCPPPLSSTPVAVLGPKRLYLAALGDHVGWGPARAQCWNPLNSLCFESCESSLINGLMWTGSYQINCGNTEILKDLCLHSALPVTFPVTPPILHSALMFLK